MAKGKISKRKPASRKPSRKKTARANGSYIFRNLDRTVLAIPLIKELEEGGLQKPHYVIIDPNLSYRDGKEGALADVRKIIVQMIGKEKAESDEWGIDDEKSSLSSQYLFARLTGEEIAKLVNAANKSANYSERTIYKIWNDFEVKAQLTRSVSTIKADAARAAFAAGGKAITWAVMDSGIDAEHIHFKLHDNLNVSAPLSHMDFSGVKAKKLDKPEDPFGHGTHVAGIIAGEIKDTTEKVFVISRKRDESGDVAYESMELKSISGVAPQCRLLSLRVLDENGDGRVSNLIAAIGYVQKKNGDGRMTLIQGVNMSVGYEFEPEWFACGQSPLCVEINRLVRSGVVVVVSAGNTGYGFTQSKAKGVVASGLDLTINDPGNAEFAITVGSTHREMPHMYGVSYFSSKGPTGDGRMKPDLVAPGEKIVSCAAGSRLEEAKEKLSESVQIGSRCSYHEDSGTSMSAAMVSGAIAAFLSIRREFINQPERVKEIFLKTATDLNRAKYFQGNGLIDLMRAIQSV